MTKLKEIMENKIFKIIMGVLKVIFVAFVIIFVAIVYMQRISDNKISFFKYRMFTVISGSMDPKYKIGDVLISKEIQASKIKVGDDISYLGKSGDVRNKIVTHQVVEIEKSDNGKYTFHTKGISNIFEDPIVYEEQLYGIIVSKSKILSFVYKIVATNIGLFLCVVVPLIVIIAYEIVATAVDREEKKRAKLGH